jgi:hypothetical protein
MKKFLDGLRGQILISGLLNHVGRSPFLLSCMFLLTYNPRVFVFACSFLPSSCFFFMHLSVSSLSSIFFFFIFFVFTSFIFIVSPLLSLYLLYLYFLYVHLLFLYFLLLYLFPIFIFFNLYLCRYLFFLYLPCLYLRHRYLYLHLRSSSFYLYYLCHGLCIFFIFVGCAVVCLHFMLLSAYPPRPPRPPLSLLPFPPLSISTVIHTRCATLHVPPYIVVNILAIPLPPPSSSSDQNMEVRPLLRLLDFNRSQTTPCFMFWCQGRTGGTVLSWNGLRF